KETFVAKVARLEEHSQELNNKWAEANANYELTQKELSKTKSLLENVREELDKRKSELSSTQEGVRNLEVDKTLLLSTIEDLKQEIDVEKSSNKEKVKQITNLKDLLSSSHTEIDEYVHG